MTITVNGPNGVTINFPEGTDAATINQVMTQAIGGGTAEPEPVAPAEQTAAGFATRENREYEPTRDQKKEAYKEQARGYRDRQSTLGEYASTIGRGLSRALPFADDLTAAGNYLGGHASSYEEALDRQRAFNEADDTDRPVTSYGSQVIGGLALPAGAAARGATMAQAIGRSAATGAAYGAAYGAGSGDGLGDRASKAATGALVGAGAGAIAPPLVGAIGWGINKAVSPIVSTVRGITNVEREAATRVSGQFADDARQGGLRMTEQEAADAAARGQPVTLMDQGGEGVLGLARSAANNSPEARGVLNGAVGSRVETQFERAEKGLGDAVGGVSLDDTARLDQLKKMAQRQNQPAYNRAYAQGQSVWDNELADLLEAPAVRQAVLGAERTGANRAVAAGHKPVKSPFTTDDAGNIVLKTNPDGSVAVPNLEFWDHVQRNMRDVEQGLRNRGKAAAANDIKDLLDALLQKLDAAVPAFQQARAGAAAHFGAQDALDAGRKFAASSMTAAQAQPIVAKMTPAEKKLFAEGYAAARRDQLSKKGDRSDLGKAFLHSHDDRAKAALALGHAEAAKLEATMHVEKIMNASADALKGNSTTARQLAEMGLAGGVAGGYSNDWDWRGMGIGAVAGAAARRYGDKKVFTQVAKMLASGDPQKLQQVQQIAAKSPKYMNALRSMSVSLERIGTQQPVRSGIPMLEGLGSKVPAYADEDQTGVPPGRR